MQLCLEGFYDGRIFHRVVPEFVLQGGALRQDTGEGGVSIYPEGPFKSEFHSRLKFVTRGLVACASRERDKNDSQFFICLQQSAPELDRRHTIFGQVVGNTLFNALKANDLEVDEETERPVYPPVIHKAEVFWNPFDDIVPRTSGLEWMDEHKDEESTLLKKKNNNNKRDRKSRRKRGAETKSVIA